MLISIKLNKKGEIMKDYLCIVCGYIYHPEENKNIPFKNLPSDWVCPLCGVGKADFERM